MAAAAREELIRRNVPAALFSLPTLKPFPRVQVAELATTRRLIVTIEEHSISGGLGGSVAEVVAEAPHRGARLLRCGLADKFYSTVGNQDFLRAEAGLTPQAIAERVIDHRRTTTRE